jgi:hypothetical protein
MDGFLTVTTGQNSPDSDPTSIWTCIHRGFLQRSTDLRSFGGHSADQTITAGRGAKYDEMDEATVRAGCSFPHGPWIHGWPAMPNDSGGNANAATSADTAPKVTTSVVVTPYNRLAIAVNLTTNQTTAFQSPPIPSPAGPLADNTPEGTPNIVQRADVVRAHVTHQMRHHTMGTPLPAAMRILQMLPA